MQLGKLAARGLVNAVSPGQLVHIMDQSSNRRFLVDTGAAFSVFAHSSPGPPCEPALAGAASQSIPCWGEQQFQLSFTGKAFSWPFLLAAVQFPIIGVDFLCHFGLLVDPASNQLVDRLTMRAIPGCPPEPGVSFSMASSLQPSLQPSMAESLFSLASPQVHRSLHIGLPAGPPASSPPTGLYSSSPASTLHTGLLLVASTATCGMQVGASGSQRVNAPSGSHGVPLEAATQTGHPAASASWVAKLLGNFPDVVNASGSLSPPVHDVQHHIKTNGPPMASRFRRLEGAKLEASRKEFEAMESDGIVQRSTSPWAYPLHMEPKKDGSWRPCRDFRRLNRVTEADVYPLPNMLDFF